MGKRGKALERLLSQPTDFTWNELIPVMAGFGYDLRKSGGSSRKFVRAGSAFYIHEPHPQKILKAYQVRAIVAFLREQGDVL
jgi:hypothetical protein